MYATDQYSALGTTVEGGVRGTSADAQHVLQVARDTVRAFERQFSRFRADSELTRLNEHAGTAFLVSEAMLALLAAAQNAWRQTGGVVDPTIGNALCAAGYNTSFDQVHDDLVPQRLVRRAPLPVTLRDVAIDHKRHTVTVPRGTSLDFGGIGKGYLLDRLTPLFSRVTEHWWYSLGGDMIVSGHDENGSPWKVAAQDPFSLDRDWAEFRPPAGRWGIATSGTVKRRGVHFGAPWHHLIDTATSLPSTSDVPAATALAPTALLADISAKTVILLGSEQGLQWAENQLGVDVVLTRNDGTHCMTRPIAQYLLPK